MEKKVGISDGKKLWTSGKEKTSFMLKQGYQC